MEIYTLELFQLRRLFSEVTKISVTTSEVSVVTWMQVECLRHMNFMLEGVIQIGVLINRTRSRLSDGDVFL